MQNPRRFLHVDVYGVFGIVFAACLLVQGWTWLAYWPLDHEIWVDGVQRYARGRTMGEEHLVDQYPATTILLPAGALAAAGLTEDRALRLTMAFLISLVAGLTAATAFLLRPTTRWWVFVAWLLVFQPLYTLSTPPSALLTPLAALFSLLVLLARERNDYTLAALARIGICGGAMAATRVDMSAVFVAAAILYLSPRRAAALHALPVVALAAFLFFDPYFLLAPVEQLFRIFERVMLHAEHHDKTNALESIGYASPFGVVAAALAAALLSSRRLASLPRDFTLFLLAVSGCISLVLFVSRHHPPWLFYPAFLVWELLLPLVVMDGIRALPERSTMRSLASRGSAAGALAGGYMAYQLWLFQFRVM
jgi:hypothetical protein